MGENKTSIFTFPDAGAAATNNSLAAMLPALLQNRGIDSATLPVLFGNAPLTGFNGEPVTAANLSGTGIYVVYYNSRSKLLQLLTGITPTATAPTT